MTGIFKQFAYNTNIARMTEKHTVPCMTNLTRQSVRIHVVMTNTFTGCNSNKRTTRPKIDTSYLWTMLMTITNTTTAPRRRHILCIMTMPCVMWKWQIRLTVKHERWCHPTSAMVTPCTHLKPMTAATGISRAKLATLTCYLLHSCYCMYVKFYYWLLK